MMGPISQMKRFAKGNCFYESIRYRLSRPDFSSIKKGRGVSPLYEGYAASVIPRQQDSTGSPSIRNLFMRRQSVVREIPNWVAVRE